MIKTVTGDPFSTNVFFFENTTEDRVVNLFLVTLTTLLSYSIFPPLYATLCTITFAAVILCLDTDKDPPHLARVPVGGGNYTFSNWFPRVGRFIGPRHPNQLDSPSLFRRVSQNRPRADARVNVGSRDRTENPRPQHSNTRVNVGTGNRTGNLPPQHPKKGQRVPVGRS